MGKELTITDTITVELLKIEKKHGSITAPRVVETARPLKSPLHRHFEWADGKAAQEYRLWQARQLISVVRFKHEQMTDEVRRFTSVTVRREIDGVETSMSYYLSTEKALANSELREQILERAKNEARNWALKYKNLVELSQLISLISTL